MTTGMSDRLQILGLTAFLPSLTARIGGRRGAPTGADAGVCRAIRSGVSRTNERSRFAGSPTRHEFAVRWTRHPHAEATHQSYGSSPEPTGKAVRLYNHVLVGTDGSVIATAAVEAAALLAQAHGATLTIAYAFDPWRPDPAASPAAEAEFAWVLASSGARAEAVVAAAIDCAQLATCGGLAVNARVEPGRPVAVLAALTAELRPDVVVVGNADVRPLRLRRSIGHALTRRVSVDLVIVDTVSEAAGSPQRAA